jgi:hypothetical protein
MKLTNRLQTRVEDTCRAVIDDAHPGTVEAVGCQEHRGFEGSCQPGDAGLLLGAPGRQGADPHGHQRVAAVLAGEKPLHEAAMRVVCEADAPAMASEGVPHD